MAVDWKLRGLQVVVAIVFTSCNIGLNFYNSWLLHAAKKEVNGTHVDQYEPGRDGPHFTFPVFYTMWHMLASVLGSLIIISFQPPETGFPNFKQFWHYRYRLIPLSMTTSIYICTNNMSLTLVSLFINQVIKSTTPFPTMVFSAIFEKKGYGWGMILSCGAIVAGTIMSIPTKSGGPADSIQGIIILMISVVVQGFKPVIQAMVMAGSASHPKLAPTVCMCYDCSLSFCFMLTYWVVMTEREPSLVYISHHPALAVTMVVAGSLMAFAFNLSNYYFIKLTSSLTTIVAANGIKVLIIGMSAIQQKLNARNWCGVALTCVTLCLYAYFSYKKYPPARLPCIKPRAPAGDVEAGGKDLKKVPILTGTVSESTPLSRK